MSGPVTIARLPDGESVYKDFPVASFNFQAVTGGIPGHVGRDLVLKYHYSGTFHPVYVLMGLAYQDENCIAACCFRTPAVKWRYPVLELGRQASLLESID